jgi:fluoride exporter
MTASLFLVVAAGGLIGTPSRYLLDRAITRRVESDLPWGTFVINVTGSFLLGFITGLALAGDISDVTRTLIGTGFCGAYTTFSTFTFETARLIEDGRIFEAGANVVLSMSVGLGAAAAGLAIGLAL